MNLVCLDTHYFKWGILRKANENQQGKIEQAAEFFRILDRTDATIIVPTPVITELLMGAAPDEAVKIISVLESDFRVVEFDENTAKVAAAIWNKKKGQADIEAILKSAVSLRTKMKIDTMILATAMTSHATILYTEDADLTKLAYGFIPTGKMPGVIQGDLFRDSPTASSQPSSQSPTAPPVTASSDAVDALYGVMLFAINTGKLTGERNLTAVPLRVLVSCGYPVSDSKMRKSAQMASL